MKLLQDSDRSCSCKQKNARRLALPQRTAGWQVALDPDSRRVLGAAEHLSKENMVDKITLVTKVLQMGVNADLLIHDDCCH